MHILIIEDDERIAKNLRLMLEEVGFRTSCVKTAEDGLYQTEEETYDAVILDWMLPDEDGIAICKKLRSKKNGIPILMLTAKSQIEDKIEALNTGVDDYLSKPFIKQELIARLKALIRRASITQGSPSIKIADLTINTNTTEVKRANKTINLAPREYELLEYLALHKCTVIDRLKLLHHVWGEEIDMFSNTVDVHIRYLRKKIDEGFKKQLIKTVKNKGYMLCEN